MNNRKIVFKGIATGVIFFILAVIAIILHSGKPVSYQIKVTPTPVVKQISSFSYSGQAGKSALELLKAHATITTASSGLVDSINGRKADDKKHEYWGFFINGKLADVGPADYQTKNSDTIEWKIQTY